MGFATPAALPCAAAVSFLRGARPHEVWLIAWLLPHLRQTAFGYSSRACCTARPPARAGVSAWPGAVAWQPSSSLPCAIGVFLSAVAACCFAYSVAVAARPACAAQLDGLARCLCVRSRRHGLWLRAPGLLPYWRLRGRSHLRLTALLDAPVCLWRFEQRWLHAPLGRLTLARLANACADPPLGSRHTRGTQLSAMWAAAFLCGTCVRWLCPPSSRVKGSCAFATSTRGSLRLT